MDEEDSLTRHLLSDSLYDMKARLNARIDDELARKIEVLRRRLDVTTTEVVRRSVERFYQLTVEEAGGAAAIIERSGLIGCAEGPADLSARYKDELSSSLEAKVRRR